MQPPIEMSADFQAVIQILEKTTQNIFITGRAGTGKSTLLQLFRSSTRKKIVVLAPTGIAALNVQGQTIHSFFGFPPRLVNHSEIKKRRLRSLYTNLDMMVIDEISMVRADVMDAMDYFLRINREKTTVPFGGVQMVFFGDLFQLPPVVASEQEKVLFSTVFESQFFFSAKIFEAGFQMMTFQLQKIYRQEARHFIRLLDAIRLNQFDMDDLDDLNERHDPIFLPPEGCITLSARNATADTINERELNRLIAPEYAVQAVISGIFDPKNFPTEEKLYLKAGAQVMFVKNDVKKQQYVNGTIGTVVSCKEDCIVVKVPEPNGDTRIVKTEKTKWEMIRYKDQPTADGNIEHEVTGTFTQFPLKLAWAITIHKSQGKTFDKVVIDLGTGAFEHGQTYVALSRCRTLEGVVLKQKLRPRDIMTDERIVEFYDRAR
jgi:ATP-dependent DNA helicase PIF1